MHSLDDEQLCLLLQWTDSAFPSGGFAHSNGLEAFAHAGEASSPEELVEAMLRQQLALSLPAVVTAWRAPQQWLDSNDHFHAVVTNHVARRASVAQGQALAASTQRSFLRESILGRSEVHLPIAFGVLSREMGFPDRITAIAFGFATARSFTAASVRLGMIGPFVAQQLLARGMRCVLGHCTNIEHLSIEQCVQISPLAEILQGTHDRLYSRLFVS